MGDTDIRSGFTLLKSLADKNVYRIFTGGNHTWVLLDEFIPVRKNFRPPSPLEGDKFKLSQLQNKTKRTLSRDPDRTNKLEREK